METPSGLLFSGEWVDRFYSYAVVVGECWLWTRSKDKYGYGKFGNSSNGRSLSFRLTDEVKTHRIAWVLNFGSIPDDLGVLHVCDVPSCINHNHFFTGDNALNTEDRFKKGRSAKGETGGRTKLNVDAVTEIRSVPEDRERFLYLADKFGVSVTAIRLVHQRKNWSHVR